MSQDVNDATVVAPAAGARHECSCAVLGQLHAHARQYLQLRIHPHSTLLPCSMQHAAQQAGICAAALGCLKRSKSALLHLVTDPAGYGEPPKGLQPRLLLLTAEFFEAAACEARGAGGATQALSDSGHFQHSSHDTETSQATQDGYRGTARQIKPYTRPKSET